MCVCVFKIQKKEAWLSSAAEAGRALSVPTPSERAPWGHRRPRKTTEVRDGHGERWTLAISSAGAGGCVRPNPMNKTHSRSLAAHVRRQKTVGSAAAAEDSLGAGGCRQGQHGTGKDRVGSLKCRFLVSVLGCRWGPSLTWVRVPRHGSFQKGPDLRESDCLLSRSPPCNLWAL